MRTVFGLLSSTVLSSLLLATACNFTDGATAGNGDPYATCISDTVTFCEARSLSDSDCNALISSTCGDVAGGNGLLDAGVTASADASTGGDNSGSGNGSGSNASCVDNAIAQCEQFGGSADQCAQVAQQLCSGGGNGSGFGGGGNGSGGGSGGGSGSGSGSGGHHGGGGGNGGGNGSGGGSGGGGGNGGGNGSGGGSGAGSGSAAACLGTAITSCVQAGGDFQTCLTVAEAECGTGGLGGGSGSGGRVGGGEGRRGCQVASGRG